MSVRLVKLDEERWGEKVRRARERAGLTVREAADIVSLVVPTSYRSIARLEEDRDVPGPRRHLIAYLALLAYGYDPDQFGLADVSVARLVNRKEVASLFADARDQVRSTRKPACVTADEPTPEAAPARAAA